MVKFDWKLTLHFLWKKVGSNSRFYQGERNRQTRYRISRLSCIKHIKKITFTELGSFESQVLLNVELPESITDCCHTLDMTSLDKIITLSVCYVSAILGSKTVTQYYWKCSFQICLHGASNNFRTRSFCIQQWKRPLSLNNLNWPHDLIIIEKITQSRATNYFGILNGERHGQSTKVIYNTVEK